MNVCTCSFVLYNKTFSQKPYYSVRGHQENFICKISNFTRKSPLIILTCWSLNISRDLESQGQKGTKEHQSNMENERTMRMEEIEKRATRHARKALPSDKNGDNFDKGEGITEDPSSRDRLVSWKNNDDQFVVPNPNDLCEQKKS